MRRIVHHELGDPAQVLRVEDGPSESLGPNQVRVRLSCAPIHPGDLLGVMGSPAFGTPPTISSGGRVPGFEGAGVVSEVGAQVAPSLGLRPGIRAAFFPAPGSEGRSHRSGWLRDAVAGLDPRRDRGANADQYGDGF